MVGDDPLGMAYEYTVPWCSSDVAAYVGVSPDGIFLRIEYTA
jgi:hypothetical protein